MNSNVKGMKNRELFEFLLKSNPTTVYYENGAHRSCWHNSGSIYFQDGGSYYDRFGLDDVEDITEYLQNIIRVEKSIDGKQYPIWTREDGIIEDLNHFVMIRDKYYSVKQIEGIFENIEKLKADISSIAIV